MSLSVGRDRVEEACEPAMGGLADLIQPGSIAPAQERGQLGCCRVRMLRLDAHEREVGADRRPRA